MAGTISLGARVTSELLARTMVKNYKKYFRLQNTSWNQTFATIFHTSNERNVNAVLQKYYQMCSWGWSLHTGVALCPNLLECTTQAPSARFHFVGKVKQWVNCEPHMNSEPLHERRTFWETWTSSELLFPVPFYPLRSYISPPGIWPDYLKLEFSLSYSHIIFSQIYYVVSSVDSRIAKW